MLLCMFGVGDYNIETYKPGYGIKRFEATRLKIKEIEITAAQRFKTRCAVFLLAFSKVRQHPKKVVFV